MVWYAFSGEKKKGQKIPPHADAHQRPHPPFYLFFSWHFVFSASFILQHKSSITSKQTDHLWPQQNTAIHKTAQTTL